jgi:hypothetical protein
MVESEMVESERERGGEAEEEEERERAHARKRLRFYSVTHTRPAGPTRLGKRNADPQVNHTQPINHTPHRLLEVILPMSRKARMNCTFLLSTSRRHFCRPASPRE